MFPLLLILKIAFLVYALFVVLVCLILKVICRYFEETKQESWYRLSKGLIALLVLSVVMGAFLWFDATALEPNWIEVKKITIASPLFDEKLERLKIVQISDLHVEKIGFREKSLIKKVNALKPDLILMNGDYINSRQGWEPALEILKQLKAKEGIYTILGNTDYYFSNEQEIIPLIEELGIKVLLHESIKLDLGEKGSFWLTGLSDKYGMFAQYGHQEYVSTAFAGTNLKEPKILLLHDPDHALTANIKDYNPQLILAGDTHGGQFGIAVIRRLSDYANRSEYMAGKFTIHGHIPLYVNRGIGMKTLNIRFLCRPEITVFQLKKGKS